MFRINDGVNCLKTEARHLDRLSEAFFLTGNQNMGEQLAQVANAIRGYADEILASYEQERKNELREAKERVGGILSALVEKTHG